MITEGQSLQILSDKYSFQMHPLKTCMGHQLQNDIVYVVQWHNSYYNLFKLTPRKKRHQNKYLHTRFQSETWASKLYYLWNTSCLLSKSISPWKETKPIKWIEIINQCDTFNNNSMDTKGIWPDRQTYWVNSVLRNIPSQKDAWRSYLSFRQTLSWIQ